MIKSDKNIPLVYNSALDLRETERAIKFIKRLFRRPVFSSLPCCQRRLIDFQSSGQLLLG
jgi:hypothetical protein